METWLIKFFATAGVILMVIGAIGFWCLCKTPHKRR